MRKEVVFAIIIGLILGGVILYGIQIATQSAQNAANTSASASASLTPSPTPTPPAGLIISSPANHAVLNAPTVKITGKTLPSSTLAYQNSEDDGLTVSDANGNFSFDIKLVGGENIIKISVLKNNQALDSAQISVIYTTAKIQ